MQFDRWGLYDDADFLKILNSEPLAPIGNPPRDKDNRNGGGQAPPNRQQKIREQAEQREDNPKDFPFHRIIVGPRVSKSAGSERPRPHFRHVGALL